jgi:hypothetical protein
MRDADGSPAVAGMENLGRLKSALRRSALAMTALRELGLAPASVERLHLGLKQPYRSRMDGLETRDALCFPLLGEGMRALSRYAYRNLPGVTANPGTPTGWGPGSPAVYRLGSFSPEATAVLTSDVLDCWLVWQWARGEHPELAFLSRTHSGGWPAEWNDPGYWRLFKRVLVVQGAGAADFLQEIAPRMARQIEVMKPPAPFSDLTALSRAPDPPAIDEMLDAAKPWSIPAPHAPTATPEEVVGRFQASPIRIAGAFSGGYCYYPVIVEARELETLRGGSPRVVQSYETMVIRSDGSLLTTQTLPAPRGTPLDRRVLALSDGTRLLEEPMAAKQGTWSFAGIERFIAWRRGTGARPFRPLPDLLHDVELFLSSRVSLPGHDQQLLAALYVAMTFVFQVFDAIPLLLVVGARGTGKSELGAALARLSFNAVVATQLRAAGMIRLLDETRGLLVLDDMDGDAQSSIVGTGQLAQAIKTSYKASTARKPVADRGGRVRLMDFFGPKLITNTKGVDDVLGSRLVCIRTAPRADLDRASATEYWSEARIDELRDELHAWGMASASEVRAHWERLAAVRSDRSQEILAPLRAIVGICHDCGVSERFEQLVPDCLWRDADASA